MMCINLFIWFILFCVVLLLVMVVVFYLLFCGYNVVVVVVFLFVVVIDWFDGYFVCCMKFILVFGVFFDLVVDKLMVVVMLFLLVELYYCVVELYYGIVLLDYDWFGVVMVVIVVIIVGCEISILVLCEWMVEIGMCVVVKVVFIGKFKMVM